jgi:hypothetical protein
MPLDRLADSLPWWLLLAGFVFWGMPIALRGWLAFLRDLRSYREGD